MRAWPADILFVLVKEVLLWLGKLVRVREVARAAKVLVRRMLNQFELPPIQIWQEKLLLSRVSRRGEFNLHPSSMPMWNFDC